MTIVWIGLGMWLGGAAVIAVIVRAIPGAAGDSTMYAIFVGLLWPVALIDVVLGSIRRRLS